MPRYYFDIDGDKPYRDNMGEDLASDEIAWRQAMRIVREIEDVLTPGGEWCLHVRAEETLLFRIKVLAERVAQRDDEVQS
ncbi:DUF6894 family protein [Bradyrhizobium sp.]|uniref:DUF6894 family protein n=1 Tax=Bradyrhizobium sp. TaxID=376 RepID=UPI001D4389F4|nr:hypothetical protein [Bradyrhizobium sp.]MBV8701315.1 hypothetical protein [Bradyrhizobium sp.]MBV8918293.1 hypothetical protein [Bradyrhizobium sp.]MBV9981291.1 hypothetical protein [Bradyrhizobium sp.]